MQNQFHIALGVHLVHMHPQCGKKNLDGGGEGGYLQGKVVSAPPGIARLFLKGIFRQVGEIWRVGVADLALSLCFEGDH